MKKGNGASVLLVVLLCLAAFLGGWDMAKNHFRDDTQKVDTIIVEYWDTLTIEKPTEIVRYITRFDTIRKTDTTQKVIFSDSTAIIPIESVIYKDSTLNAKYEAFLSGFHAQLDSIRIECLQTEKKITNEIPARRFGVGIQAGFGAGKDGFTPYVGIGLNYRIW